MRALAIVSRLLMAFCMLLGASGHLQAQQGQQTEQAKPFQPEVGQSGKDVIWVPTPQELVNKMLDLAKVTPQDYVIDLGSGDGRIVIAAAKRGARALVIEYNPDMVELSKANAAKACPGAPPAPKSRFSEETVMTECIPGFGTKNALPFPNPLGMLAVRSHN